MSCSGGDEEEGEEAYICGDLDDLLGGISVVLLW